MFHNPTKETAKLSPDDSFWMGQIKCTVTQLTSFSGELHYGFTYVKDNPPGKAAEYGCGWMPAYFVESFTGYFLPDGTKRVASLE